MKSVKLMTDDGNRTYRIKSADKQRTAKFNWRYDNAQRMKREAESLPVIALLTVRWAS